MATPRSGAERGGPALAALALLACLSAAATDVPIDSLALEMRPIDADVLFKKYKYDKSTFAVSVVEPDGRRLEGRIEVKGESSRLVDKKGPLIKLASGRWQGQSRLSFNALATDASMMREWLAWDLIHTLGMVAPQVRFTNISINGAYQGLFLRVEWIGADMFKRYGHERGELYDPIDLTSCADLGIESVDTLEACWVKLLPRGDSDPASLAELVRAIEAEPVDTFDAFLDRRFHADSVIDWIAVTVVVENLTTYNNEYWPYYSQTTGKWLIVPWDYDRSLGKTADPWQPYPGFVFNDNFQYYYPLELGASNALRDKVLKNPELRRRLRARIGEIVDGTPDAGRPWRGWFASAAMQARIDRLYAIVRPLRARDPFLSPTLDAFDEEVGALRHFVEARAHYLRQVVLGEAVAARDSMAVPAVGRTAHLTGVDGRVLAWITPRAAARGTVRASVFPGVPELVPPGIERPACVQRSWRIEGPPGLEADVLVEYLQEFKRTSEVGPAVRSEQDLALYVRDGAGWWRLPTRGNTVANTLQARVRFDRAGPLRLAACGAPVPAELAVVR